MAKIHNTHAHMKAHGYGSNDAGMSVGKAESIATSPTHGINAKAGGPSPAGSNFGIAKSPTKGKNV